MTKGEKITLIREMKAAYKMCKQKLDVDFEPIMARASISIVDAMDKDRLPLFEAAILCAKHAPKDSASLRSEQKIGVTTGHIFYAAAVWYQEEQDKIANALKP